MIGCVAVDSRMSLSPLESVRSLSSKTELVVSAISDFVPATSSSAQDHHTFGILVRVERVSGTNQTKTRRLRAAVIFCEAD